MVVAAGKGIDRAHGKSDVRLKFRKPLTWDMLVQGWEILANRGPRVVGSMDGARAVLPPKAGPQRFGCMVTVWCTPTSVSREGMLCYLGEQRN